MGARGSAYNASCPADMKQDFESAYHSGYELYTLRARVADATNEIESSRQQIAQSEKDLVAISAAILDPVTDNTARAQALLDAKNIAQRQGQLKARIRQRKRIATATSVISTITWPSRAAASQPCCNCARGHDAIHLFRRGLEEVTSRATPGPQRSYRSRNPAAAGPASGARAFSRTAHWSRRGDHLHAPN
jgi:hypothetical protein